MSASSQPALSPASLSTEIFESSVLPADKKTHSALRFLQSLLELWHLLSLDAPTVASLWVVFIARAAQVVLPWSAPAAMFVTVWILYVCDRLLDARSLANGDAQGLEARHRFHFQHRRPLFAALSAACVVLVILLRHAYPAAIRLHVLLGTMLLGWLLLIHLRPAAHRLPKELAVGIFFPAAVFIPTVARVPELRLELLPSALLLAAACSLNCLYIYAWEHPHDQRQAHSSTRWAVQHLPSLNEIIFLASLLIAWALSISVARTEIFLALPATACAASVLCLLFLDRYHKQLEPLTLRAAADGALLTPVLFLAFGRLLFR